MTSPLRVQYRTDLDSFEPAVREFSARGVPVPAIARLLHLKVRQVEHIVTRHQIPTAAPARRPSADDRLAITAALAQLAGITNEVDNDPLLRALAKGLPLEIALRVIRDGGETDFGDGVRVLIGPAELQGQAA